MHRPTSSRLPSGSACISSNSAVASCVLPHLHRTAPIPATGQSVLQPQFHSAANKRHAPVLAYRHPTPAQPTALATSRVARKSWTCICLPTPCNMQVDVSPHTSKSGPSCNTAMCSLNAQLDYSCPLVSIGAMKQRHSCAPSAAFRMQTPIRRNWSSRSMS